MTAAAAASLASRPNTSPSAHPVRPSNENAVDARLLALQPSAQTKFERLRQLESRMSALRDGLFDQRERIRDQRDNAVRSLGHFDRLHKPEAVFTSTENPETGELTITRAVFPERDALVNKIESINLELARLSDEQRAANPNVSTEAILDWLAGQSPSTKFAAALIPGIKPTKGESFSDLLARNHKTQAELRDQLNSVQSAPLTAAEAKQKMRDEVARLADVGRPDVGSLLTGGEVGWPSELLVADGAGVHTHIVAAQVPNARALLIWANRDEIVRALEAEIDRQADDANALSREDQRARARELEASLLSLQRSEEALIERLGAQGQQVRRSCTNPLILLGIQAA